MLCNAAESWDTLQGMSERYDVQYMTLDERQDWIKHLLSEVDVAAAQTPTLDSRPQKVHQRDEQARGGFYISQWVNCTPRCQLAIVLMSLKCIQ